MDRYDRLVLAIIHRYRFEHNSKAKISLHSLEKAFWKEIENDRTMSPNQGRIGERVTSLYLKGLIENKEGYYLTRKGKVALGELVGESA